MFEVSKLYCFETNENLAVEKQKQTWWKIKMASRLKDDLLQNKNNETEELLVFGYSCKLFRDDEKALFIDQGKHLIPWMGDETLKIDRYDARGTLFDLNNAEAPSGGFDRFFGLTDMEKQVETMCDEERYRALITNEEEESLYQEEELKRLHYAIGDKTNSYGQVEYKYEGDRNAVEENPEKPTEKPEDNGDDEPFVPSPFLDLPINMVVPETVKHNAIIEKTAMFINNQGPQMEILLKMKQAGNPQFNFLSFDNPLHNYYRHLLMAIKTGRFKPDPDNTNRKSDAENDEDDHYLHPSLAPSVSKVESAPSIPSINYKPSAHCAYSMLVNKIKDKKSKDQGSHFFNLKEALDNFKDNKTPENGAIKFSYSNNQYSNNETFVTPPKDMQIIIDKMASYVAKNGRDFETVVQMKNDPRFDFLNSIHSYNAYYQFKIQQYEKLEKGYRPDPKTKSDSSYSRSKEDHSKNKFTPVCFSIKKPKDAEPVIEKSALPIEESSEDEAGGEKKEKEGNEEKEKEGKEDILTIDLAALEEKEEKNKKILATERLKDKLTAVARGKVAMATKEKQLQLERKRRAAAFLKTINSDDRKSPLVYGPQLPGVEGFETEGGGSDVASLSDLIEDANEDKKVKRRYSDESKHRNSKSVEDRQEKRHRSSNSNSRHKDREKSRSRKEKYGRSYSEHSKSRDISDRITDSSYTSEDDERGSYCQDRSRRSDRSVEDWRFSKMDKSRHYKKEERRHKRKKHKKREVSDRNSRKHSRLKRDRRSRGSEDNRNSRSKRSRRNSSSSSGDQNS